MQRRALLKTMGLGAFLSALPRMETEPPVVVTNDATGFILSINGREVSTFPIKDLNIRTGRMRFKDGKPCVNVTADTTKLLEWVEHHANKAGYTL